MTLAHAADIAFAAAAPPGGAGGLAAYASTLLPFAAMAAIFYFIVLRPQQRQKAERERMLGALKRGDRVVTSSGLHGTVTGDRKSTRLNSSHRCISYAVFCLKKKKKKQRKSE